MKCSLDDNARVAIPLDCSWLLIDFAGFYIESNEPKNSMIVKNNSLQSISETGMYRCFVLDRTLFFAVGITAN